MDDFKIRCEECSWWYSDDDVIDVDETGADHYHEKNHMVGPVVTEEEADW